MINAQIAKKNNAICYGQEVSTHRVKVLTHEYSKQRDKSGLELKVSTHGFKVLTHEDSRKSGTEGTDT